MSLSRKYYEELFIHSDDERELSPKNQDAIIELLDMNGAVGVFGMYDEPGLPIYFVSGFSLTAIGYSFDEMIKVSEGKFTNLIFEKDREVFLDYASKHQLSGREFRMKHSSGKNVWVKFHSKASISVENHPIIVASIRVVDDARKRESELLDALTKGYNRIIYVDVNQGRYRVIKSEDGVFDEQVFGTIDELHELLQRYGRDYIIPDDYSFAEMLNKLNFFANPGEKGGNYQVTYQAKVDGEYKWVQFQAFYGGAMNLDTGHFILTFRVVDEEKKKELETNKILSDSLSQAEEARRAKNKFLSRMSHDLRTPINGIVGMIEIAGKNKENPKIIEECLEKISVSCDNLMSLVQEVLDMNNLESGNMELSEENINLYSFLTEELKSFSERAKRGGFTYLENIDKALDTGIIGSPKHIWQILDRILDNAIKYNKPNGSITMNAREVSRNDKVVTVEFVVEDTGLGMDSAFVKKVFEPFEQEHGEVRTSYMGTGLGMSIVKILVEEMNGKIDVESKLGEGTKMFLTIPFKLSKESVKTEMKPEDMNFDGMRVLLVEDNEMNMEIAQFLLESKGMKVTCAVNGQEAVEKFAASEIGEFQIILMDIMMPIMDGLEAARAIRSLDRPDAKNAHIIALSANVMDSDIKKTRMAGMDEHLPKPINTEQLLSSITKCLQK